MVKLRNRHFRCRIRRQRDCNGLRRDCEDLLQLIELFRQTGSGLNDLRSVLVELRGLGKRGIGRQRRGIRDGGLQFFIELVTFFAAPDRPSQTLSSHRR